MEKHATNPTTITLNNHQIRTIKKSTGTWFVSADVCKALGYPDAREAISHLNPEEKNAIDGRVVNDTCMILSIVSRSGLKKLVQLADDPDAVKLLESILSQIPEDVNRPGCHSKLMDIDLQNHLITDDILCKVQSLHLKALGKSNFEAVMDTMQVLRDDHPKEYGEALRCIDIHHNFLFDSMQEAHPCR